MTSARLSCSFCGRSADEVGKLFTSKETRAVICDDCLYLCLQMLAVMPGQWNFRVAYFFSDITAWLMWTIGTAIHERRLPRVSRTSLAERVSGRTECLKNDEGSKCSFCGIGGDRVRTLINGPAQDLFICNACVAGGTFQIREELDRSCPLHIRAAYFVFAILFSTGQFFRTVVFPLSSRRRR